MTSAPHPPTIILIAGHWLGAWAWDEVLPRLNAAQDYAVAMTLPGLSADDPDRATRTLDDQADAILELIGLRGGQPVILVAHSGANAPVSLVLDRRPELVQRVVWVDSGPVAPGSIGAPDFPAEDLPLPAFDALATQASLEGLSASALARFRERAVSQPGPTLRHPVALGNEERHLVPTTLVCCSLSSAQIWEFARAGHPMFSELTRLGRCDSVDLPTGHWPMWSRPDELAEVILAAILPAGSGPERGTRAS